MGRKKAAEDGFGKKRCPQTIFVLSIFLQGNFSGGGGHFPGLGKPAACRGDGKVVKHLWGLDMSRKKKKKISSEG